MFACHPELNCEATPCDGFFFFLRFLLSSSLHVPLIPRIISLMFAHFGSFSLCRCAGARLIFTPMRENEAFILVGAEQFAEPEGYAARC